MQGWGRHCAAIARIASPLPTTLFTAAVECSSVVVLLIDKKKNRIEVTKEEYEQEVFFGNISQKAALILYVTVTTYSKYCKY